MLKGQWAVLVIALLLIIGMFQLPKVVVSDDDKKLNTQTGNNPQEITKENTNHSKDLSPEDTEKLARLKSLLELEGNSEKRLTFADSIAGLFRSINRLDSGAYYISKAVGDSKEEVKLLKAANAYFEAFQFAVSVDTKRADVYGAKAREYFQKVIEKNPKNYSAKANMAMTYTVTQNPMQGITLLREILAEDEDNEAALFNLGVLSMRSGQTDKAIQRFEKLLQVNPNYIEARLLLAQSWMTTGEKEKAKQVLDIITQSKADSLAPFRAAASDILNQKF
jgi:outer membrane protein